MPQAISNRGRRAASAFRQGDVTKAIRAAKAAGVDIARIEIAADGRIVIIPEVETAEIRAAEENEWDRV